MAGSRQQLADIGNTDWNQQVATVVPFPDTGHHHERKLTGLQWGIFSEYGFLKLEVTSNRSSVPSSVRPCSSNRKEVTSRLA